MARIRKTPKKTTTIAGDMHGVFVDAESAALNLTPDALVETAQEAEALNEPIELDVGDIDMPGPSDLELDRQAEDLDEPPAETFSAGDMFDGAAEPTIEAALAEISPEMETAVSAGVVDHHSQFASWTAPAELAEALDAKEIEAAVEADAGEFVVPDLDKQRHAVAEHEASVMVWNIRNQLDDREMFEEHQAEREALERGKEPNLNIKRTLKKVREQMVTLRAAKLLCAIAVDPAFINRTLNEGSRYNVYALGKLSDVIYGVTDGMIQNAINLACMRTLFEFRREGLTFSMETAKAACSKQYAIKKIGMAVRSHILSHTVSESTAPTQASSTMQALTTLGVVRCNGAGKNAVYELTDAPIVKKLEGMLRAA